MDQTDSSAVVGGAVNWVKLQQPKKFDFANGVQLVGILIDLQRTTVRDRRSGAPKPVVRYTVREVDERFEQGETFFFFGTNQIDNTLRPDHIGHYISVTCTGEDRGAGRNGNAMKLFDISASEQPAPGWAGDGTQIGDGDLGF